MNNGKYRQRLTEMGWWGVVFVFIMPLFSVFFYNLHLNYAEDVVRLAAQDLDSLSHMARNFSNIFAVAAVLFLAFPLSGIVMIFMGREFYNDDAKAF